MAYTFFMPALTISEPLKPVQIGTEIYDLYKPESKPKAQFFIIVSTEQEPKPKKT